MELNILPRSVVTSAKGILHKKEITDKIITLAGNPNVGKSTLFNRLTGMNQHTGNWAGKTVGNAQGYYKSAKHSFLLVDIPGTYSLIPHSAEEKTAGDFICFGKSDAVAVVCDATCLERNLSLALQISEVSKNVLICVNLMDEAHRKGISLDLKLLSDRLSMPVVGAAASKRGGIAEFKAELDRTVTENRKDRYKLIEYPKEIEVAVSLLEPSIKRALGEKLSARWVALRLLSGETEIIKEAERQLLVEIIDNDEICLNLETALMGLEKAGFDRQGLRDAVASSIITTTHRLMNGVTKKEKTDSQGCGGTLEKIFTGRYTAYPIMLLLLGIIFWLTISGANYPSAVLSRFFEWLGRYISDGLKYIGVPDWLYGMLFDGAYRVVSWVVAVMLPPMAIFFPFFTILEDSGFLPRIAYNLDLPFKKCSACGKQALTMCMGFGCNAAGVTGARIIDSKRERLIAVLTNSFVPCNGKFPAIIAVITMFFGMYAAGNLGDALSAFMLLLVVILGILLTFLSTSLLSKTLLKGIPSSFTLELPPYRKPKIGEVIVRSVFDRTLFVLGRAVTAAIPAGVIIWCFANIQIGNTTLLSVCANALDPIGRAIGLDGVILISFILGIPANEIVVPIMIMAYTSGGVITEMGALAGVKQLLESNGWTPVTALCVIVFFLCHWPCATTLLTIKKETGSTKWTFIAFLLPTIVGFILCSIIAFLGNIKL